VIRFRWFVALFAVIGLALACAGCASPNAESDLPWNMTQPWESAPSIPFGTTGAY
jgi:hypothetical protein